MLPLLHPPAARGRGAQKMSERIAQDLAVYILGLKLPEGTRLPSERVLLEQMKIGRATLREALRLLESRGVISIKPGRTGGPVVRRPRAADLSDSLALLLSFEFVTLGDVLDARERFEPMIARAAARNASKPQRSAMARALARLAADPDTPENYMEQVGKFHATLAEATGNPVLRVLSEALLCLNVEALAGVRHDTRRQRQVLAELQAVLAGIAAQDEAATEAAMQAHRAQTSRRWRSQARGLLKTPILWTTAGPGGRSGILAAG